MSFDTLAPIYRTMELVTAGNLMQRCRIEFISETRKCTRALVMGEGPGRFLVPLLKENPNLLVTCVENSARMISEAKKHLRKNGLEPARVEFIQCDALRWEPANLKFDLIVTHFFLDCFTTGQLRKLAETLAGCSAPETRWLVADFQEAERGWKKLRAQMILRLLYNFFNATTGLTAKKLAPIDPILSEIGFRLLQRVQVNFGLLHSDLWVRKADK